MTARDSGTTAARHGEAARGSRRLWRRVGLGTAALLALAGAAVVWLNVRGEDPLQPDVPPPPASAAVVERGAYLARAGNCLGCHTTVGGAPFAGGRGIETPFGVVFASNLTPDPETGIGRWSAAEFRRAMRHGRSKDGRLLYPAFPYPSFSILTREDADALFAYLTTVPPVRQANQRHALRFPFSTQAALAVWRALYFAPSTFAPDASRSAAWNRGKYLVEGLGHCAACHSARDALGGTNAEFAGGLMPDRSWYAPSLATPAEAGVQGWPRDEVVGLLKNGVSARGSVSGPMAEVVYSSTQHLGIADLDAMAEYLQAIPIRAPERPSARRPDAPPSPDGARLYRDHCAACHGAAGQGVAGIYPALAGNRAVTLHVPNNLVQIVRRGGFPPTTPGNPRPFGMPPFAQVLDDDDVAAVVTHIRQSWGHDAAPVSALDVLQVR